MFRSIRARPWRAGRALPVGLLLGLLASGALVWHASQAAFTAQTSADNHIGTGSVAITNERTGQTLITISTLTPGQSAVQCVLVTFQGTVASTVRLYAGAYTDTDSLGNVLTIKAETADAGGYGNCASFAGNITTILPAETADTFAARATVDDGAPSVSPWTPTAAGQTKAYRIAATLPSNASNTLQGASLDLALIWGAQSV